MSQDNELRHQLKQMLTVANAHISFEEALVDYPVALRGHKLGGFDHTPWQLLEHIRIDLWDLLEYNQNPNHVSPDFPDGYWPDSEEPPSEEAWDASVATILNHVRELAALAGDETVNPLIGFPWNDAHNLMRQIAIAAKHNSYHLGQIVLIKKAGLSTGY